MSRLAWLVRRPIAHRGLHDREADRFENTISAAEAAIAADFAIECDVQVSSDGEAMVFHDHTLDRLTAETGPVCERTSEALSRLAIGGTADTIPTLDMFVDRIADRTPLVVEVKSRFDGDERLVRRVAAILAARSGRVAVKSFDPAVIALLRQIAPDVARGIVGQGRYDDGDTERLDESTKRDMTDLLHWPRTEPQFVSWRLLDLPCAATALPRAIAAIPVMTWTVRSELAAARARAHADQIVFEGFTPV